MELFGGHLRAFVVFVDLQDDAFRHVLAEYLVDPLAVRWLLHFRLDAHLVVLVVDDVQQDATAVLHKALLGIFFLGQAVHAAFYQPDKRRAAKLVEICFLEKVVCFRLPDRSSIARVNCLAPDDRGRFAFWRLRDRFSAREVHGVSRDDQPLRRDVRPSQPGGARVRYPRILAVCGPVRCIVQEAFLDFGPKICIDSLLPVSRAHEF